MHCTIMCFFGIIRVHKVDTELPSTPLDNYKAATEIQLERSTRYQVSSLGE